jgi:hypothetical protein
MPEPVWSNATAQIESEPPVEKTPEMRKATRLPPHHKHESHATLSLPQRITQIQFEAILILHITTSTKSY